MLVMPLIVVSVGVVPKIVTPADLNTVGKNNIPVATNKRMIGVPNGVVRASSLCALNFMIAMMARPKPAMNEPAVISLAISAKLDWTFPAMDPSVRSSAANAQGM